MAGYALYIPSAKGANPQHLRDVGLDSLATDGFQFADVLSHAPDGKQGIIGVVQKGDLATDPPFTPESYTWTPAKACKRRGLTEGRFFFGTVRDKPVAPRDIQRKNLSLGYYIDLRDGHSWHIPAAVNLPHVYGLNGDGELERQIGEQYREFWSMSEKYAVQFFQAIDQIDVLKRSRPNTDTEIVVNFACSDGWEFCCKALSINYRLTPELIDMLGLLDDLGMRNIIKAAIDLPTIFEVRDQKKTDGISIPVG